MLVPGAILWRLRGMYGWPGTLAFAMLIYWITGEWWYALWVYLGELPGWGAPMGQVRGDIDPDRKPERYQRWFGGYFWLHPWQALAFRGFWIGGIGAVALPLSVWLSLKYSPAWPKKWWSWGWAEAYFGALFVALLMFIVA